MIGDEDLNADDQNTDATEADASDSDIDAILAEYETDDTGGKVETKEAVKEAAPVVDTASAEIISFVKEQRDRNKKADQEKVNTSLDGVVGDIKKSDDRLANVSTSLINVFIQSEAMKDTRLANAFFAKDSNPDAWAKIEKNLTKKFIDQSGFGEKQPDEKLTSDRESARAAAEGKAKASQSDEPTDDEIVNMTPQEFEAHKVKMRAKERRAAS